MSVSMTLTALQGIPLVHPGDDLGEILWQALLANGIMLQDGDILVLAQKIVSKAEGRLVNLSEVTPSAQAEELARFTGKDARFVELVLRESRTVLRYRPGTLIVEHRLGFVCANAGIDHSNVEGLYGNPEDWVLLLPEDPDASARRIQQVLQARSGVKLGVLIIDSHGRAWRLGTVGVCIGVAGVPAIVDLRGRPDLFGYQLRVTQVAAADELAAAASLIMGQADEKRPVVHVRGFPYPLRESSFSELRRPEEQDLFR
ncbi:coenzyme F420-0:L-glutamate ligase [Thermanaerothrix sp.]|jgi:coenzyme F420-0:L-glutamate ligase/coenzyme F420-1:gamma-L-glutamate ligase|uniref:coenzyme F420-0:L-glutamate ligase n=1 Tax=Thermanaerothrix sp. TaxID=2972675 RepID=UPI002ADDAA41|nr:coenzyme F420-0:L-glutamate ligase [Thermanaerothrix sp.]